MKLLFWNTYGNKKINSYIEGVVDDCQRNGAFF